MSAEVIRGYLYVEDEKGSYKIPVGRRSRRRLTVLEEKKGEYVRSLEIDLFTGFVYYCVDNATSGGLSYYYDMSSKKVGHYFIHRYLRTAKNHGYTASPLEMEIFEKLPCADWEEQLQRLPGWKEKLENRIKSLLLPETSPVRICAPGLEGEESDLAKTGPASISFVLSPAAYPTRRPEKTFRFENGRLRHRDETIGTEFLAEDEEYERILTPADSALISMMLKELSMPLAAPEPSGHLSLGQLCPELSYGEAIQKILPQKDSLIMQELILRYPEENGSHERERRLICPEEEKKKGFWMLYALLRGLMRREIEVTWSRKDSP